MNASEALSAGLKAVPNKVSSFASTQAAWRFYENEAVTLSNVKDIDASTIALWYYWRWKIETFFKLMKSAGH